MFDVKCALGFHVKLTDERYFHIITRHPEILDKENELKAALENPEFIKRSLDDSNILLFYKASGKEYIVVVVKDAGGGGFILTAYITDFIKEGDIVWKK